LIGVVENNEECGAIKANITKFMKDKLELEMSAEKTLITKAIERGKYLGI
jgi:Reverse transcriptase (RNA-dependent DNA polymerase).